MSKHIGKARDHALLTICKQIRFFKHCTTPTEPAFAAVHDPQSVVPIR